MPLSVTYNQDCLEYMRTLPDNFFDLLIADPPYGDGLHAESGGGKGWFTKYNQKAPESEYNKGRSASQWNKYLTGETQTGSEEHRNLRGRFDRYNSDAPETTGSQKRQIDHLHSSQRGQEKERRKADNEKPVCRIGGDGGGWKNSTYGRKIIEWDVAPSDEMFAEMFRVSRNQIIWGGNYFDLPPTRCFLIWRKLTISEQFTMAMAEYAWTSFNANAKVYECAPQGRPGDERFHPTQKPIELYRWIYGLFTEPGQKVFDPMMGSQSSRLAAWDAGLDYTGCEIDPIYFEKGEERFERYTAQISLFE